jgi:hypothetical protein
MQKSQAVRRCVRLATAYPSAREIVAIRRSEAALGLRAQFREERLMKRARKIWHTIGAFSLVFGLSAHPNVASGQTNVASGQNFGNPGVVPPSVNEFGNPYGEWTARWWQWLLSIPDATNPNLDTTGAHCAEAQTGQVWFLAGGFGGPAVTRRCTIPAGKDLLLSPRNTLFGEGVGDCTGPSDCNPTALRELALEMIDDPTPEVRVDNVAVKNLDQYRVTSPVFNVFFPQGAVFGLEPGTHGPVVSDGFWLLLKPLSQGAHTIHVKSDTNGGIDVTWKLTVSAQGASIQPTARMPRRRHLLP